MRIHHPFVCPIPPKLSTTVPLKGGAGFELSLNFPMIKREQNESLCFLPNDSQIITNDFPTVRELEIKIKVPMEKTGENLQGGPKRKFSLDLDLCLKRGWKNVLVMLFFKQTSFHLK